MARQHRRAGHGFSLPVAGFAASGESEHRVPTRGDPLDGGELIEARHVERSLPPRLVHRHEQRDVVLDAELRERREHDGLRTLDVHLDQPDTIREHAGLLTQRRDRHARHRVTF